MAALTCHDEQRNRRVDEIGRRVDRELRSDRRQDRFWPTNNSLLPGTTVTERLTDIANRVGKMGTEND